MEKEAQRSIRRYRKYTLVLSVIGFGLAYYSVYVSMTKSKDPKYEALCDISETMRCSKVFTSSTATPSVPAFGCFLPISVIQKLSEKVIPLVTASVIFIAITSATMVVRRQSSSNSLRLRGIPHHLLAFFGKGLGIVGKIVGENSPLYQSNGVYGMFMYSAFALCSLFPYPFFAKIGVFLGVVANLVSAYLAYILFFIIQDVCIVCISTYTIGFILLIIAMLNLAAVKKLRAESNTANYSRYLDGKGTPGKKRI